MGGNAEAIARINPEKFYVENVLTKVVQIEALTDGIRGTGNVLLFPIVAFVSNSRTSRGQLRPGVPYAPHPARLSGHRQLSLTSDFGEEPPETMNCVIEELPKNPTKTVLPICCQ